jgi:hypothetical protein
MAMDNISVLRVGIVLEGDGGVSTGAIVLDHRIYDDATDEVLCLAPKSPDKYVIWKYDHKTGRCSQGQYYGMISEAVAAWG